MAHYLDTSAFLKVVVEEEHSSALTAWLLGGPVVFSSQLMRTEALRTARRHSPAALLEARSRLDAVPLLHLAPDTWERAAELDPDVLRTLDAVHLAAALTLGPELESVVTYDERLARAAAVHGVLVTAPT